MFTFVRTKEEFAIEQLYGDYSENKLEQYVHDENVDDVFQRINDAIENRFQFGYSFDGFQGTQDAQYSQRLDRREILTSAATTVSFVKGFKYEISSNFFSVSRSTIVDVVGVVVVVVVDVVESKSIKKEEESTN